VGVKTLFIEPGSPRENGFIESFNAKLHDELLNREIFDTLLEAKVLTERWRQEYKTIRTHSSLGYRPPAPDARLFTRRPSRMPRMTVEAEQVKYETTGCKVDSFPGAGQDRLSSNFRGL